MALKISQEYLLYILKYKPSFSAHFFVKKHTHPLAYIRVSVKITCSPLQCGCSFRIFKNYCIGKEAVASPE